MSPIILDVTSDFNPTNHGNGLPPTSQQRTLLLAPPSLASHEERISALFSKFDRAATDLHMLDRLAAGLVSLPATTYDLVLVLTEANGNVPSVGGRDVWAQLVQSIKAGGRLRSESGPVPDFREAVLAGLLQGADGSFEKPEYAEEEVVPLRFGLKKKANGSAPAPAPALTAPKGVGFVDFSDDLDLDAVDDDDDLIDEDTLLTVEDLRRPIPQPPECQPQSGKKKRACKDCTCGLAERLEAEDKARRAKADSDLNTLKLKADELTELDFTVKGKTGSCNSCYLGDAFRCADCPYIGLPAFKPGEEVKIVNNVAQL